MSSNDLKEKSNVGTSACINSAVNNSTLMRSRRYNSSPVRPRRLYMKETVPTALVSPQTVQVTVQPPMLPYGCRGLTKASSPFQSRMHYVNDFSNSDLNCSQNAMMTSSSNAHYSSYNELPSKYSSSNLHDDYNLVSSSSNNSLMSESLLLNSAVSDDRLESLEKRMRFLESCLQNQENLTTHPTTTTPPIGRLSAHHNYNNNNSNTYRVAQSSHSSYTNLPNVSTPQLYNYNNSTSAINNFSNRSPQEVDILKDKIKKLQFELDSERRMANKNLQQHSKDLLCKVDENETLRCKVKELVAENQMWKERFHSFNKIHYQPKALENLIQEKDAMHDTIKGLQSKLDEAEKLNNISNKNENTKQKLIDQTPPIDQFVSLEKYRLLKAKSKKLLTEKCRSLRAEILEKDSLKVQLQLQNAELSELRKTVYEPTKLKCDCAIENSAKIKEEMLKLAQNCHFAASCVLGVCEDISAKKCPDYDQILGLKSSTGASISEQKLDQKVLDNSPAYYDRLLCNLQNLHNDITRIQRIMVDYYSNQLVDAIDCRIQ